MKRYDLELTATGPVMEERLEGAFVPFFEVSWLAEQLADATRQCGVMAELLRKARTNVDQVRRWGRFDHDEGCGAEAALLLERIDALMAGQMLHHPEQPLDMVSLSDIHSIQRYTLGGHCDSFCQDCGAEMEQDDDGEYILLAEVLKLAGRKPQGGEPCAFEPRSSSPA